MIFRKESVALYNTLSYRSIVKRNSCVTLQIRSFSE